VALNGNVTADGSGYSGCGGSIDITAAAALTTGSAGINARGTLGCSAGSINLSAGGPVTLNSALLVSATTAADGSIGSGGNIWVEGTAITADGAWSASGGTGGSSGGGIDLTATTGAITVLPTGSMAANGSGTDSYGGYINLTAPGNIDAHGALTTTGTSGGGITITSQKTATITGNVTATGSGSGWGGSVWVQGTAVATNGVWSVTGGTGGGGEIDLTAGTGSITLPPTNSMTANGTGTDAWGGYISATAAGDIAADGSLTATGSDGGVVTITSQGAVSVSGDISVTGSGTGWGGAIYVTATGDLVIAGTSTFTAYTTGTNGSGFDGNIDLRGCNVNLAGDLTSRNSYHTSGGGNRIEFHGYFIGTSTALMNTDSENPNQLVCPCKDWTCTSCAHDPTFFGTATPSLTYSRQSQLTLCQ